MLTQNDVFKPPPFSKVPTSLNKFLTKFPKHLNEWLWQNALEINFKYSVSITLHRLRYLSTIFI